MTTSNSPVRPRISGRDILPILLTGLMLAGAILLARRVFGVSDVAGALTMGIGFMLALAGVQGHAEKLTARGAVVGWLKLCFIAIVVLLATGRLTAPGIAMRLGIFLAASLGASVLLFLLRTRRQQ
jgi:hypothetical protein